MKLRLKMREAEFILSVIPVASSEDLPRELIRGLMLLASGQVGETETVEMTERELWCLAEYIPPVSTTPLESAWHRMRMQMYWALSERPAESQAIREALGTARTTWERKEGTDDEDENGDETKGRAEGPTEGSPDGESRTRDFAEG